MPPRKRGGTTAATAVSTRELSRAASDIETQQQQAQSTRQIPSLVPDNWTDDQEITLFKAVIKWKPAGMHKHFRMLSIAQLMKNHGVADAHTNIKGIWAKLNTLYNLEAIDDQEEAPDDGAEPNGDFTNFELPGEEYNDEMIKRRYNPEGSPDSMDEDAEPRKKVATPTKLQSKSKKRKQPERSTAAAHRGSSIVVEDDTEEEQDSRTSASVMSPRSPTASASASIKGGKKRGRPPKVLLQKTTSPDTTRSTRKTPDSSITTKQLRPRGNTIKGSKKAKQEVIEDTDLEDEEIEDEAKKDQDDEASEEDGKAHKHDSHDSDDQQEEEGEEEEEEEGEGEENDDDEKDDDTEEKEASAKSESSVAALENNDEDQEERSSDQETNSDAESTGAGSLTYTPSRRSRSTVSAKAAGITSNSSKGKTRAQKSKNVRRSSRNK